MPALAFLCRTVGGRGVCVVQTCTDARAACNIAHVGTTRLMRKMGKSFPVTVI